jgi:nucleoside-diphosphate-sugar epimerase
VISESDRWDVLCHHAAHVRDYKSADFDYTAALSANTLGLPLVLSSLEQRRCSLVCITGTVFEGGEGAGSQGVPAFSPYGLSKELTHRAFEYYCYKFRMRLAKFVISNPFGPFEDPRFTAYLINTWSKHRIAEVRTPEYVRDNIHVGLLAAAYRQFVDSLPNSTGNAKLNPSGYIESQGRFAERFAEAMRPRLRLDCTLALLAQTSFDEPRVRVNTEPAAMLVPSWSEDAAWDELADYYQAVTAGSTPAA